MLLIVLQILIINGLQSVSSQDYIIRKSIDENKNGGMQLTDIKKFLRDKNLSGFLEKKATFHLITQNRDYNAYFMLDSKSGIVKLRTSLDREEICRNNLNVELCRINLLISVNSKLIIELELTIEDENDESPQFALSNKVITIQENSELGLEMTLPTAKDRDSSKNGIVRYYMRNSGNNNLEPSTKYFSISQKSVNKILIPYLKVIKKIDRETVDNFHFLLIAEDSGKLTGSTSVSVKIRDLNDNGPQWNNKLIKLQLKECANQGVILELQAYDLDDKIESTNGQIKYKISDHTSELELINKLFYIAGDKLYLSSHSLQNIQIRDKLSFYITAVDGGGRENDTRIEIEVIDCNDHPPDIQLDKSSVNIQENDASQIDLITFTVKDNDKGINSEFDCTINDTKYFKLKEIHTYRDKIASRFTMYTMQKLAGKAFDRELVSYYSIVIQCRDKGSPPMIGERRLGVNILDVNDNAPQFPSTVGGMGPKLSFAISENNAIGSLVGYIRATDSDLQDNSRITYRLEAATTENSEEAAGQLYFSIGSQSGALETKQRFDREIKDQYHLIVVASDSGVPTALSQSCSVVVRILDINDCSPTFRDQYFYRVVESNGPSTVHVELGQVQAQDKDLGENATIYYKLRPVQHALAIPTNGGGRAQPWQLLRLSGAGQLSILGQVDREQIASLQMEITAYDNGRPQLTGVTTVIVDILDLNDNSPRFIWVGTTDPPADLLTRLPFRHQQSSLTNTYLNVTLSPSSGTIGSVIATFIAIDPDKDENGTVHYSLVDQRNPGSSQTGDDWFQLQDNGKLILARQISPDRGILGQTFSWNQHRRLLVKASDGGSPPRSEILTVHMRYINPVIQRHYNDRNPNNNVHGNSNDDRDQLSPVHPPNQRGGGGLIENNNLILLYVLAAVLFVVFLIVLIVLLYTYFTGRLHTHHHSNTIQRIHNNQNQNQQLINNSLDKVELNNSNPFQKEFHNDYECDMVNTNPQNNFNKYSMDTLASIRGDKSAAHYTHLVSHMMTGSPGLQSKYHSPPPAHYTMGMVTSTGTSPQSQDIDLPANIYNVFTKTPNPLVSSPAAAALSLTQHADTNNTYQQIITMTTPPPAHPQSLLTTNDPSTYEKLPRNNNNTNNRYVTSSFV